MQKFVAPGLDLDYYADYLTAKEATQLFDLLSREFVQEKRRKSVIIGDAGVEYRITYRGATKVTIPRNWSEFPGLEELKQKIAETVRETLTVCVVQYYPSGEVGILPHRDKEMVAGTKICGLSLGQSRQLVLGRDGYPPRKVLLESGSLYVMNDPTNQKWLHSITKDNSTKARISLTFRNY